MVFRYEAPYTTRPRSWLKFQLFWPSRWKMSDRSSMGRPEVRENCGSREVRLFQYPKMLKRSAAHAARA